MKQIVKRILLLVVFLTTALYSYAGNPLRRGYFDFGPKVEFTDNLYATPAVSFVSGFIMGLDGYLSGTPGVFSYLVPHSGCTRFLLQNAISTPDGDAKMKWWDWKMRNHAIGYYFAYQPTVSHLGYNIELDYERQSRMAMLPGMEDFSEFSKSMVTPGLTLQYQFSDLIESSASVTLVVGAKYNYAFKCSGLSDDVHSVNNGFTGTIGLGFAVTPQKTDLLESNSDLDTLTYFNFRLMYSRDLFNYFNTDYVNEAGIKPYEGWGSKYGYLTLSSYMKF